MYEEFDIVRLTIDLPKENLFKDSIGTIVYVYLDDIRYEVEFKQSNGTKVVTLQENQFKSFPF